MRKTKFPFERDKAEAAGEADYFPCYIAGEPWRYALATPEQMKILAEEVSDEPAGLCVAETSSIYLLKGSISHTIAIHEIMHAYFAETLTHSAKLTADQVEEVMCDITAFNWCRIVLLAHEMVHNLLGYEDYLNGNHNQDWMWGKSDILDGKVPENMIDLLATYSVSSGLNPLLRATAKKKRRQGRS